ncbi:MAG: o-succinylbenzoate synthase [Chlorobiaceae bacterium]|nr:o-succinylbenzoate synthase [Chlorobiaceae bacterium]NTV59706.1 o-succinylbenzoate synthase [Chlorobiaceae bacterium]
MNISHLFLYRYAIPFTEPVTIRGHRITERDGIVLALKCRDGERTAYGEIAPLPGLHRETLDMAEAQLVDLVSSHALSISGALPDRLYPSVQTGIEMALINLEADASGSPPSFFPESAGTELLPLNALLFGDALSVTSKAETLYNLGYRAFKLKVDAGNAATAIECIHTLNSRFGSEIELRLDANQSFTLEQAVAFAGNLPAGSVSYIEEPLQDAACIGEFHARTSICSALDETLWQHPELYGMIPKSAIKALILKPNRLGGIAATREIMLRAASAGHQTVLSSAFESGISLGLYAWLAATSSPEPAACGLDTFRYLNHDLTEAPFGSGNSLVDARKAFNEGQKVNLHTLKLLSIWTL